ncbi:hypothetical protein ACLGI4_00225 [Streptomyces sp. HMX112]
MVDTLGLLLGVMVTSADTGDRAAARGPAQAGGRRAPPSRPHLGR